MKMIKQQLERKSCLLWAQEKDNTRKNIRSSMRNMKN